MKVARFADGFWTVIIIEANKTFPLYVYQVSSLQLITCKIEFRRTQAAHRSLDLYVLVMNTLGSICMFSKVPKFEFQ